MKFAASLIAASLFLLIAAFQLSLVLGAPWGEATQGGFTDGSLPLANRVLALVSMLLLVAFALAILARAGLGPAKHLPHRLITAGAWVTTVYACVGVLLNAASQSSLERAIWVPIGIALAICCFITMVTSRGRT